jgi:ubiquinone biosynthesis protein
MMLETLYALRDLPRLREISVILIRHGFGDMVRRLGIVPVLERAGQALRGSPHAGAQQLSAPERVRMALAEAGPTFVKLGQVLATRVDLFAPEWIAEFEKLQNQVPPVPFESLLPEVSAALGRSPFEVFRDLDTTALGSASIAQVHAASLQDGTRVVLKIRRPGIQPKVQADLRILSYLAGLIEAESPEARLYQPRQIVAEFAKSMAREMDLALEARQQERFAQNFTQDPTVLIPRIYWEWTSPVMNVQQFVDGIPGNDFAAIEAAGLDRGTLAARGADAVLKMILVDGFFHADPHPGNVFYLPGNRIGMIDFGMAGRLSDARRTQVVNLLESLAQRDAEGMAAVLLEWAGEEPADEGRFANDIDELVFQYANVPLGQLRLGLLLAEITAIMRNHHIVLPSDMALLFKALITLEGLGQQLEPNFQIIAHVTPFVRRLMAERYRPGTLIKQGRRGLHELLSLMGGLPRDFARALGELRRGRMKLELDLKRLDHFGHQIDRSANRLTVGVLTAALIIGSSIVMTVQGGPTLFGLPVFGLIGFLLAFLNGIWLIISIWRSGRD